MEIAFMTNPLIVIKKDTKKRQLTTGESEDCTAGCLLDYEYLKNHYRLIAV